MTRDDGAPPDDDDDAAFAAALRILGGASQSASALTQKLRRRGFQRTAANSAVERCRALGYIDDRALAKSLVGRQVRAGHGRARIVGELRRRGVAASAASEALLDVDEGDETRVASELAQKLYDREAKQGEVDDRARRRIAAALQRRGFAPSVILRALRSVRV